MKKKTTDKLTLLFNFLTRLYLITEFPAHLYTAIMTSFSFVGDHAVSYKGFLCIIVTSISSDGQTDLTTNNFFF